MVSDLTVPVRARRARVDAARAVSGLGTHLEGRTAATSPAESARRLIALLTPRGFFASLRSMLDGFLVAELLLRTAAAASDDASQSAELIPDAHEFASSCQLPPILSQ
ncbi:MAG: hypothetical protein ACRDP4_03195 [Nocardioidaceae bacterium]